MNDEKKSAIYSCYARQILDSRATPTIETTVILESGHRGTASVPSGISVGKYEALELRDNDPNHYNGLGVLKAVTHVNSLIAQAVKGMDVLNISEIDKSLIALDGTPRKEKLGANAILSVSLASVVAASKYLNLPPYRYINKLFSSLFPIQIAKIPTPMFNMINGGKHGAGNLNFQEFHIIPSSNKSYTEALETAVEIYYAIRQILEYRNAIHSVGDEGGFAPNLFTNADAFEIITEAIRATPHQIGVDIFLGMDVAASTFKTDKGYAIKDRPAPFTTSEFVNYLADLHKKYHFLILEDPIDQDDTNGWKQITQLLGKEVLILGDDLLASSSTRLSEAMKEKYCLGIVLKPNQIGTTSELLSTVLLAKKNNFKCVVAHRSGETNDTLIADLAVGIQADFVKFGGPARGERIAKYNRLLEIETEIKETQR